MSVSDSFELANLRGFQARCDDYIGSSPANQNQAFQRLIWHNPAQLTGFQFPAIWIKKICELNVLPGRNSEIGKKGIISVVVVGQSGYTCQANLPTRYHIIYLLDII